MHWQPTSRRKLPHLALFERPLFITFRTYRWWTLPPEARTIVLRHVLYVHGRTCDVHIAVVMPDHVHVILTVRFGEALHAIMKAVKGTSARAINQLLGRKGHVWNDESFDHVVRTTEGWRKKAEYIAQNPVRRGLVARADDYPWLWRSWVEGGQTGLSVPHR